MKKIYISIIIVSLTTSLYSQMYFGNGTNFSEFFSIKQSDTEESPDIDGTPYFYGNWKGGQINYDKKKYLVREIKYNIYKEELLFKKNDIAYTVPDKTLIAEFSIDDDEFVNICHGKYNKRGFLKVLVKNENTSLYKKYSCQLVEGKSSNGIISATNDAYSINCTYYIKTKESQVVRFVLRKKRLYDFFLIHKGKIKKYIKQNKLKIKREKDLIKIINYCNSL